MVPERQSFHPSQKAVKAMADSTVSRPRRSRAKYRDNKTVEAKPSRPAHKRRRISRMDSLSDSKTSDGSDSFLEVPAGCGPKVSGSQETEVPGTCEPQDAKTQGSGDPVTQGSSDPVSQGSVDPVNQGSKDPVTQGSHDPVTQGSHDPVSEGSHGILSLGSGDAMIRQSEVSVSESLEVLISEFKQMEKRKNRVNKSPKRQPRKKKKKSDSEATPAKEPLFRSTNKARHDSGSSERMLMRQWLESEADGGSIPGLKWLDKQDGLIRINWRHGSRAEWSKNDVTVFRCWAEHTGRYNSKDPDYKRWKANFRCAVNSLQDVKEVKEKRGMKAGDPYKVYRLLPAILPRKRRRESVKSARSSSPENIPMAMEMPIATEVTAAEPMESEPLPLDSLPPELFLHLMPLPSSAECEPVIAWSSGPDLDCIPTSEDMENLVTLDAPFMYIDHCYANTTDGSIVQKLPSLPPTPVSPPSLAPPPLAPFNNAIPLPVQNLMDSEDEEEEEFQAVAPASDNLENLNEMNISEFFSFADVQGGSISSTNDSTLLLESVLQAILSQSGIIISTEAVSV